MQVKLVCTDLVALARSRPDRHFRKSHCQALGMSLYGSFLPGRPKADLTSSFGCVRFGSRPCENSKVRSATRMIFLISISELNAFAMWAHETVLNE
jgi:hypothetical protein